jgi:hypothetical protein
MSDTPAPTSLPLQQVRIGKMESGEYAPNSRRCYAVWDGARRIAEGMTHAEAMAFCYGIQWGEEKRKGGAWCGRPQWRWTV